jgi:hypothetical protein
MTSISITGADAVAALLSKALVPSIEAGLMAIGAELQNELAAYPGRSGKKQLFKSAKQRRFFFAALRKGGIVVPYRRSGDLGRGWQLQPSGRLRVVLRNSVSYAAMVIGKNQADYHKGTWPEYTAAVAKVEPRAKGIMEQAIRGGLGG